MSSRGKVHGHDSLVDAVRRGDVEWVRSHPPDLSNRFLHDCVSDAYAASERPAGMIAVLSRHGIHMRFGQERMSVLHACHKIQFSDEVLEEWTVNCPIEAYYVKERDHLFSGAFPCAIERRDYGHARRILPYVQRIGRIEGSGYSIGDAVRMVCAAGGCEDLSRFLRAFVHQWPFKHPADLCCYHADATFSRIQLYLRYHRIHMDFNALVTAELPIMYGRAKDDERVAFLVHAFLHSGGASMERALSIVRRKHPGLTMHFRGALFHPICERVAAYLPIEGVPELIAAFAIPVPLF